MKYFLKPTMNLSTSMLVTDKGVFISAFDCGVMKWVIWLQLLVMDVGDEMCWCQLWDLHD